MLYVNDYCISYNRLLALTNFQEANETVILQSDFLANLQYRSNR